MIKNYQQNFDKDPDCIRSVISSLLDKNLKDVPNFFKYGKDWFYYLENYMNNNSYTCKGILFNKKDKEYPESYIDISELKNYKGINGHFYASVYSPLLFKNSKTHAVIINRNYNIIHDPNPYYKGLKEYPLKKELGYNGILYLNNNLV